MELADLVGRRRMTRSFTGEPVAEEVLRGLLAVATRAPSAGFSQGVDLVVLTGEAARERFWNLAADPAWRSDGGRSASLRRAPVVVVPVADPSAYAERYAEPDKRASLLGGRAAGEWPVPYWIVDASFVVMQLLLATTDAGLGALFFQLHAPGEAVLAGLGVPAGRLAIGAVALGHPAQGRPAPDHAAPNGRRGSPATRARRPLDEVVHREGW